MKMLHRRLDMMAQLERVDMLIRNVMQTLGRQEWLRFGVRDRLIRLAHDPDRCSPEGFTVPFFGARYSGNFDTFIDWSVYYYGAYAKEELRLLDDFLGTMNDPVFMDVGANIGHHTLFAAMRSKRVFAFEPFKAVADKLKHKLKENQVSNVTLLDCALGEQNEEASYTMPVGHNTGTGSFASVKDGGEVLSLPIRVGDEVVDEQHIASLDFIKIDTEGFEPFVLKGLAGTLNRCRPLVFFEWTQDERNKLDRAWTSLFPAGYRFYSFIQDTVVMGFFRSPTYRLCSLEETWPDGNLFAVPEEYIERLKLVHPGSDALKQLLDAQVA
jgi:FkbM family methyltransferase